MSPDDTTPTHKKRLSGAHWRNRRVEQGLPKFTEKEISVRAFVVAYKTARGCADCGYNEDPTLLQFDHLPGTQKLFTIGRCGQKGLAAIKTEIAKCEVVCRSCHAKRSARRRRQNTTPPSARVISAVRKINVPRLSDTELAAVSAALRDALEAIKTEVHRRID